MHFCTGSMTDQNSCPVDWPIDAGWVTCLYVMEIYRRFSTRTALLFDRYGSFPSWLSPDWVKSRYCTGDLQWRAWHHLWWLKSSSCNWQPHSNARWVVLALSPLDKRTNPNPCVDKAISECYWIHSQLITVQETNSMVLHTNQIHTRRITGRPDWWI